MVDLIAIVPNNIFFFRGSSMLSFPLDGGGVVSLCTLCTSWTDSRVIYLLNNVIQDTFVVLVVIRMLYVAPYTNLCPHFNVFLDIIVNPAAATRGCTGCFPATFGLTDFSFICCGACSTSLKT